MSVFTKEQIQDYHDAFCAFDKKSSGYVQATELREMLKSMGMNPTDEILERMIIEIDIDGNGLVDFDELINLTKRLETVEKNDCEG